MDDDTPRDMTKDPRRVHGPRSIGALVPVAARTAFGRGGPGTFRMLEAWPLIMGPALAEVTAPRRLVRKALTIGCAGPVAMELQHLSAEVIRRINQHFGPGTVTDLRFVQMAITRPAPVRPPPPIPPAARTAASDAVSHLPPGPLRDALAALGTAVLSETASRLGKQPRTRS